MKKIVGFMAISIVGILAVYFLFFKAIIPDSNINHISIALSDTSELALLTGGETEASFDQYISPLNLGKKIAPPSTFDPSHLLEIGYTDKDSISLSLQFDLVASSVIFYHTEKDTYYQVVDPEIITLFVDPVFSAIYPYSNMPNQHLYLKDHLIQQKDNETIWQYIQVNNEWAIHNTGVATTEDTTFKITDVLYAFTLEYDIAPTSTQLQVLKDDTILFETEVVDGHFMPLLEEGIFTYKIISKWETDHYKGHQTSNYIIQMDLPTRFRLSKTSATAGDFFTVYADYVNPDETLAIEQNLVSWTPSFFDDNGTKMAFIPLNYWAKTGNYKIKLTCSNQPDTETIFDVKIKSKNFKKQYLYINEAVEKATRNDQAYAEYNKYFNPARATITSEKLWDGPFITPLEGRVTTEFGEMRYVNDAITSYRHSGIDYAAPTGTPILAPNNGHVNLSRFLTLTGNTIVIDHGMGLFTVYFHLDSLAVKKGDLVIKGDTIGTVGSTGFSTGPHLHYTTSIGKVNFDPLLIKDSDPAVSQ